MLNSKKSQIVSIFVTIFMLLGTYLTGYADITPVSDRTPQVRDAIVAAVRGVNSAANVTEVHLARIVTLSVADENITELKEGDFDGLSNLRHLGLDGNQLTELPDEIFDGLSNLITLGLSQNQLTELPDGIFGGLSNLQSLYLSQNQLTELPDEIFDGLSNLVTLRLDRNQLTELPDGLFDGLSNLVTLRLEYSQLTELPDGIFDGLSNLRNVNLGQTNGSLSLSVSLEIVGTEQFKAVIPTGAPFDIVLSLTLTNGLILDRGTSVTIPAGSLESDVLTVTRTSDETPNVSVDIGSISPLPEDHSGYTLIKTTDLPLTFTEVPVFIPIWARTPQVAEAILAVVRLNDPNVSSYAEITDSHLTGITTLYLNDRNITSLKSGDFQGLTSLEELRLYDNQLTSLPEDIFSGLTALTTLTLYDNQLSTLPPGIFNGLSSLATLQFGVNQLSTLPPGIFNGLSSLATLQFGVNQLSTLPPGIFNGLSSLATLRFGSNQLTTLPAGLFDGLTSLTDLRMVGNQLTTLPDDIFDNLTGLTSLYLSDNSISDVSAVEDLTSLTSLYLSGNSISDYGPLRRLVAAIEAAGRSLELDITIPSLLGGRTPQVRDAIVAAVPGVNSADDVTEAHLAAITTLRVNLPGIETQGPLNLQIGDFSGLTALRILEIDRWNGVSLPDGIFDGLNTLESVSLYNTRLTSVPEAVLSLTSLKSLNLGFHRITSIPAGAFDQLTQLNTLILDAASPANTFTSLPDGVFDNLTSLTLLNLAQNDMTSLPDGVFDNLTSLESLNLNRIYNLSSLPVDVFDQLTSLTSLSMAGLKPTYLPDGIFSSLSSLTFLDLSSGTLSSLPAGIFSGLSSLTTLRLERNTVNPIPLTVLLEKVLDGEFKAVASAGAPFDIVVPLSVTDARIRGGATTLTIPTGSVESEVLTVTRTPGATDTTTVNIGTLPSLPANHTGYSLVKSVDLPLAFPELGGSVFLSVSDRTPQVRDAIVAAVPGVNSAADVTEEHLAGITRLSISYENITALGEGDFDNLTALTSLSLVHNEISSLPDDIFDDLTALTSLSLAQNKISSFPVDIFENLTKLRDLGIDFNNYSSLPSGIFDNLTKLERLNLQGSNLRSLPDDIFDNLVALTALHMEDSSSFHSLPSGIFDNLTKLERLDLNRNKISSLPSGIFDNLTMLRDLWLPSNEISSLPDGVFGNLINLEELNLYNNKLTSLPNGILVGLTSLSLLSFTNSDIDPLPLLVSLQKVADGQFKAVAPTGAPFHIVLPLNVSGIISGGVTTITIPAGSVESEVLTVTPIPGTTGAVTVNIGTLPSLPSNHSGYALVKSTDLPILVPDGSTPVSERTPQVRDAIVAAVPSVNSASDVTAAHLAGIVRLSISSVNITKLKEGDFDGLIALDYLSLTNNRLTALPKGVFSDLSSLTSLSIGSNQLNSLETGVFKGLSSLTSFELQNNQFTTFDANIFSDLPALKHLNLYANQFTTLDGDTFSQLSSLEELSLHGNQISSLVSDDLSGLPPLKSLRLDGNRLTSLPAKVFISLPSLTSLFLHQNQITSIDAETFSGLSNLNNITLYRNQITSIANGAFSELSSLKVLNLHENRLTSIPEGLFSGLSLLTTVYIHKNPVDPLPLTVTLEKVVDGQFKAVVSTGAPFKMVLPISVTDGSISGGATTLTIPAGSMESEVLTVTRTPGATYATTVNIGTLRSQPGNHIGYTLVKSADLPIEVISEVIPIVLVNKGVCKVGDILTLGESCTYPDTDAVFSVIADGRSQWNIPGLPDWLATVVNRISTNDSMSVISTVNGKTYRFEAKAVENDAWQIEQIGDRTQESIASGINIPDSNLRTKIEDALNKSSGDTITITEMETLTSLNGQDSSISDLTGLETATNLTTLKLGNNAIVDISALANLTKLTELQLWDNQITTLSDLSGLTNLTTLYLWGNTVSDISDLSGLISLMQLRLGENSITNIGTVSNLTNLTQLYLNENTITDISAITGLTNLTELRIGSNTISDITPVQNLTNLEWLDMPNNQISNISAVQNLTSLVELYFQNNSVSDLSPLVGNTGLGESTEIDIRGNPLNYPSIYTHIPALQAKDVYIDFDNRVATTPVKISGDTQSGETGATLTQPFIVEVKDSGSVIFAGVPVTFAITAGGGTLSATNTTTDANGRAQTTLTLGDTAGTNTVSVSVPGVTQTITFTATATAPVVVYITPVGDRTSQVAQAILGVVRLDYPNVSTYAEITATHIASPTALYLNNKNITTLKSGDFDGLTGLEDLRLNNNQLTSLPSGIFSGLTALINLNLFNNQLSSLPDGIFEGLTSLTTIRLARNTVDPLPVTVSLEKVAEGQFKAVVPTGATFDFVLPITVSNGSITGDASSLTIPQGSTESETLTVTRTAGTTADVTIDIGTLPSLPRNHFGYALVKPDDLPLAVITSINTAPVFTDGTAITRTVTENTVATTNIGTPIAATDTENDTLTYTLSGTDASAFDIDSSTGQLKTKTTLDYETKNTYTVTITVSDGSLTDTITVTINITDIDEAVVVDPPTTNVAPTFTDGESTTRVVSENTAAGTNIGNPVNATDANNDTLTYSLGGIDAASFDVDSTTGQLKTEASLDYESKRVYSVTITAADDELSDTTTVIISVIDVNDTVLSSGFVPVADRTAQVRDAIVDAVPNVTDAATVTESQVAAITSLNLRSKGILSLKTGDFSGMIALTDLNLFRNQLSELPPGIFDGLTALSTLRLGDNVVDPLPLFVSLQSVGTGQFKAVITTGAPFSMVLPITVTDGSISSGITSVTIPQGRAESTSFTVIGTAAKVSFGTFPSIPQGHFGYTLTQFTVCNRTTEVADAIAAAVGVSDCSDVTEVDLATITRLDLSGSAITSLQTGDFDGMVSLRTLYLENNELTSLPNNIFDDLVSLTFLSLNENKLTTLPSGIFSKLTSLTHLDIFDNDLNSLPSSVFTGLSALTSLSLKNNELTYLPGDIFSGLSSLTSLSLSNNKLTSLTAGIFEGLTQLSQLHLSLNPNANTLLTLRISLQKVGTNSVKAVVPSGAPFTMTIPVQIENGVLAGGATTMTIPIGAVESQPLTITRTAGTVAAVTVDIGTALPRLPSNHNGYNLLKSRTLPLEVLPPLNSPPVFTEGASTTRTILENTAIGTNIGDAITATDVNTADTLTYTLSGTDAAAFDIDSTTGQLTTKVALDYETKNAYSVTLTVSDSIATGTIAVTINISNVNEAPVFAADSLTTHTVAENTVAGTNIGTAYSATDVDGDTLTYSLSGQDAAAFGIDTETGQLKTSAALDYETKTIYSVTITVSDGKLNTSITVTINVTNVDELPIDPEEVEEVSTNNAPVFTDGETATRTVVENTSSSVDIGLAVSATDADNDTLTYTLDGTDASAFDIDSSTGQLKTKAALDYETKTTYTVTITASDGSLTATIEVTINVTDVAEVVTSEDGTSTDTDTDENGESVTDTDTNNEPASTVGFTPVSERTSVIRDIIVRAAGVESAGDVTETHLASIKSLSYSGHSQPSLSTLKIGDFDGLTGLTALSMSDHSLSSLPDGIFDDLTSLTTLTLRGFWSNTPLSSLPTGVFDNLTKLTYLNIGYNSLSSLPDGIFDNLAELIEFWMFNNQVSSLPDGIFDNCTSLTALRLGGNGLSSLQADVFDNLSALSFLTLGSNSLSSLPEGIFDNLSALTSLFLHANGIVSFPDGIFDNLSALTYLNVYNNPIEDFEQLRRLKANNPGIEIFGVRIPEEDDNGAPALPAVPSETTLLANFPNPFNPETWIPYQLSTDADVTLTIYNMRGVVVRQLKLGQKAAGVYTSRSRAIHWNGRNQIGEKVAAGVYFYTLKAGDFTATRKMLIRK